MICRTARVTLNVSIALSIEEPFTVIRMFKCYQNRKVIILRSLQWLVKIQFLE